VPEAFLSSFDPLGDKHVRSLVYDSWGLVDVTWSAFGSERDDTLHVVSPRGEFVLKVAHPLDDPDRLHRQLSLMEFVGKASLPFATQSPVPTTSGDTTASINGRLAHLLPFLRGAPIRHSPQTAEGLANIGAAVWQLQEHMATYPEPYDTKHPWALMSLISVLEKLDAVSPDHVRQGCERILTHVTQATLPRLAELPAQPTHNDAHTDNVLVGGQTVVGVVDWGDSVTQPRVADVAVAASYARGYHPMWAEGEPWQAANFLRQGYVDAGGPDEHADLFSELVIARLAQRIVVNLAIAQHATDGGEYARRNMVNSVRDMNDLFVTRAPDVFPSLGRDPLW
jgi:hydroxylysine kinase